MRRLPGRPVLGVASAVAMFAATAVAATGALAAGRSGATLQLPPSSHQVTVTRDAAGIPHIVAGNFTALGYGEGYAFAQDNLCTFANDVVTLEGNRSRYFGPNGTAVNYSAGVSSTNLQSDLFWRYVQATGIVRRELTAKGINGLLPQVRQVYTGWIAGYNRYLRSGKLNDPTCKGKPWVHPITLADMLLRGVQITTEASSQQFIPGITGAAPPAAGTAAARTAHAPRSARSQGNAAAQADLPALKRQFDTADRAEGSNGIGLGAQDTRSGHGMVLANPHFPWRGTERFWMAQLDVPGRYDMEGGTLMGFPLVGIGFNRHIAWTHTVSTDDRFVAYQLKLVPGQPTSYYLNGRAVRMGRIRVSFRFRGHTVRHTFYTTRWGVVATVAAAGYEWTPTTAYALHDATFADGPRAADQYFRMGQAGSVKALFRVEARWLAIPTFNTMAADDRGNAYYGDVGTTPAVSAAEIKSCMPPGLPSLVFTVARVVTLDGSRTSCAPASFRGTPQKGIFPARYLPHLFRRDYVENSNNSYWLANPSHPLTGFSPIIGLTNEPQNGRTRLGNQMIAARVAGTDGLGKPKFTISTLQRMWEGDRSDLAQQVLRDLVADCEAHPVQVASNGQTVNLGAACAALAHDNGTGRLNAGGGWLFEVWADLDTDAAFYATPFNAAQPLTTPTGLNTAPPATPLKWLADAVLNLQAHHVPVNASFGQVQHAPQSRRIPIPGCAGETSGQDMGCFNAIYAQDGTAANTGPVNAAPYGQVFDGSSLVMTTQLNPGGPVSQGILTYSQASNPRSRWYANMTRLYSRGRWAKLPYTAAALRHDHPLPAQTLTAP
ncbi:MAG TPA: penicillin acylase family protein [Solirubrobacteraceae bacterium]|nr:penicillin acylase family protein [Solirubrobacteraceae bacterium]